MQTHPNSPYPHVPMNEPPTLDNLTVQTGAYFPGDEPPTNSAPQLVNQTPQSTPISNVNPQPQIDANIPAVPPTTIAPAPVPRSTSTVNNHSTLVNNPLTSKPEIRSQTQPTMAKRPLMHSPWARLLLSSSVLFSSFLLYNRLYSGEFIWAGASEAIAGTAAVLIGLSFALSGVSYFFNFADHYLKYRKQLGQLGFILALVYALTLVIRFPHLYGWGLPARLSHAEVLLGLAAMEYFFFMILISTPKGMKLVGTWWRPLLRVGYFAYGCLIIRAIILEKGIWLIWWGSFASLPPPRLVITVFAIMVICLRLALQAALWRKQFSS